MAFFGYRREREANLERPSIIKRPRIVLATILHCSRPNQPSRCDAGLTNAPDRRG